MKKKVFALDDDKSILEIYTMCLAALDVELKCFFDYEEFFLELKKDKPDLILLDIMLPKTSGLEILKKLQESKEYSDIPVILISAKDSELEKINGLDLGADDYIAKPFSLLELRSRVRANLRRNKTQTNKLICGNIIVDINKREVFNLRKQISLTQKEFDVLVLLINNKNRVITREEIIKQVWSYDFLGESRSIDMHIKSLRTKLEEKDYIKTVRGIGYIVSDES